MLVFISVEMSLLVVSIRLASLSGRVNMARQSCSSLDASVKTNNSELQGYYWSYLLLLYKFKCINPEHAWVK